MQLPKDDSGIKWFLVFSYLWVSLGSPVLAYQESSLLIGNAITNRSTDYEASFFSPPTCDESFPCLFVGQKMHRRGLHNHCHTICIPTALEKILLEHHWECGPCFPDSPIKELGSTAVTRQVGSTIEIERPIHSTVNDLLILFFSRTDDLLPIRLDGWTTGPVCFKTDNDQEDCHVVADCTKMDGDYCLEFGSSELNGLDLATAVFYRTVETDEPSKYIFNPRCIRSRCRPAWALLTALRGANNADPIGDSRTISHDGVKETIFPSVNGTAGDKLLLAMVFDDGYETGVYEQGFRPPRGMRRSKYVIDVDEAAFLYTEDLLFSGETGMRRTTGGGASPNKDASISLIVKQDQS